eukprot:12533880-Alexandrium_andersonii.AAC.1
MCIRDRFSASQHLLLYCVIGQASSKAARSGALGVLAVCRWFRSTAPGAEGRRDAVSYTHLTLPTICSV